MGPWSSTKQEKYQVRTNGLHERFRLIFSLHATHLTMSLYIGNSGGKFMTLTLNEDFLQDPFLNMTIQIQV